MKLAVPPEAARNILLICGRLVVGDAVNAAARGRYGPGVDHVDVATGEKGFDPGLQSGVASAAISHGRDKSVAHEPVRIAGIAKRLRAGLLARRGEVDSGFRVEINHDDCVAVDEPRDAIDVAGGSILGVVSIRPDDLGDAESIHEDRLMLGFGHSRISVVLAPG